ncbi:MAG: acyltransferase [Sedimentibacter sp.]
MAQIANTAVIYDGVKIGQNVIIKDFVVIYPGVEINDNVEIMEGAVIGRIPKGAKATSRKTIDEFKKVVIGDGSVISPHVVIYTDVCIGKGTLIGDGATIREQCTIGDQCIISRLVSVNYNTKIGNKTKVMDNTHITGNMVIGNNVFISVLVATTNDNNIGSKAYDDSYIKGATIEDDVSIGAAANILPGVNIGKGSIIGASALVSKDVPPYKVVMGIPGRIVKDVQK